MRVKFVTINLWEWSPWGEAEYYSQWSGAPAWPLGQETAGNQMLVSDDIWIWYYIGYGTVQRWSVSWLGVAATGVSLATGGSSNESPQVSVVETALRWPVTVRERQGILSKYDYHNQSHQIYEGEIIGWTFLLVWYTICNIYIYQMYYIQM